MPLTKVSYSMITGTPVNIEDFGAVGDGATNNTTAVQNAITQAQTNNTSLYIPDGVFVVTALTVTAPLKIYGTGTLKRLTNLNSPVLTVTTSNFEIDGITILGPEADSEPAVQNEPERGISVEGVSTPTQLNNIVVKNCIVNGFGGMGIWMQYVKNVRVENNDVSYCGYSGIHLLSPVDAIITKNRVSFINATSYTYSNWYGISLTRNASLTLTDSVRPTNIIVSENIVHNIPKWIGIDCHSGYKINIVNNNVYYCAYGISLQYDSSSLAYPSGVQNCIVSNNNIEGPANETDAKGGIVCIGQATSKNDNITITDNIITNCGSYANTVGALYVTYTDDALVSNNYIYKSIRHGIGINGVCSNLVVKNNKVNAVKDGNLLNNRSFMYVQAANLTNCYISENRFQNDTGTSTYSAVYGIWYTGSSTSTVFSMNRMSGMTGTSYLYNGSSNVYTDFSWELESEQILFSYTTTGGSPTESVGSKLSSFRRTPATTGTFPYGILVNFSLPSSPKLTITGNNGNIYTPIVYTVDGTNIGAGATIPYVTYAIQGIYWTD